MPDFVICVDLQKNSSLANVKIHLKNCQHHGNRKVDAVTESFYAEVGQPLI
jgi:hypothetical protein